MISLCQRQILACILLLPFPSQQGSGRAHGVLLGAGTGREGPWARFGVHAALLPVAARFFCLSGMLSNSAARLSLAGHTDDAPVRPADPARLSGQTTKAGLKRTFSYSVLSFHPGTAAVSQRGRQVIQTVSPSRRIGTTLSCLFLSGLT